MAWADRRSTLRRRHTRRASVWLFCAIVGAAGQVSCDAGVQTGAAAARLVVGGGGQDADAAGESAAPPIVVPAPLKTVPPGAVFAHEVLARMQSIPGAFKRAAVWRKEFADKRVAGQGVVTKFEQKDFFGTIRIEVWLDLDDDYDTVEVMVNYMASDLSQFIGVGEGARVWFEGDLKRYEQRLMVAGDVLEVAF